MKELNEYKQEIFHRSDEKKRKIRKRRRIAMAVGIPLCLCCVITVAIFPFLHMGMKGGFAPSMESVNDAALLENEAQEMPVKEFRITDPAAAARVLEILKGTPQENTANKDELSKDHDTADQVQPDEFRLTLQCSDGSTLCYQVWGPEVYCKTTGESFSLSDTQLWSLFTLLTEAAEQE